MEEFCKQLNENGFMLQFMDPEDITEEMCLIAVISQPQALAIMPKKFFSHDFFLKLVKRIPKNSWYYLSDVMLSCIPEKYITRELYLEYIKIDPERFCFWIRIFRMRGFDKCIHRYSEFIKYFNKVDDPKFLFLIKLQLICKMRNIILFAKN